MRKMHPLQKAILDVGKNHNLDELTLREIGKLASDTNSSNAIIYPQRIKHHLEQLKKKGLLYYDPVRKTLKTKTRNMTISGLFSIPILGAANCGNPTMLAAEDIEGYIKLSASFIKPKKTLFAIRAIGNSMNAAHIGARKDSINDGDYVIVDPEDKNIKSGDYILSIIDGMANIKRLRIDKERKMIALISESKDEYAPIYIHEDDIKSDSYLINGKVVKVIKNIN